MDTLKHENKKEGQMYRKQEKQSNPNIQTKKIRICFDTQNGVNYS